MKFNKPFMSFLLIQKISSECCDPFYCLYGNITNPSPNVDSQSPPYYSIQWTTDVLIDGKMSQPIVLAINRSWAPLGSDRFYSLMLDGYYNNATFFRVVDDFVVQFGIAALPYESEKWNTIIPDDPVVVSNLQWTVSYATGGPNTRTTQLFINTVNNTYLDDYGFSPFGVVTSGYDTILAILNPTPNNTDGNKCVTMNLYDDKSQ